MISLFKKNSTKTLQQIKAITQPQKFAHDGKKTFRLLLLHKGELSAFFLLEL